MNGLFMSEECLMDGPSIFTVLYAHVFPRCVMSNTQHHTFTVCK